MLTPKPARDTDRVHTSIEEGNVVRQVALATAVVPLLGLLWALTHRYQGLARDGELYAVQALARLQPALGSDLFLQNTSQDRFTIFSPLYARFIDVMGLQTAESALFSICAVWFLIAAWSTVRRLTTTEEALFSVALIIVTVAYYGAYQIFSYSENYLTARSLGESMIATSIALHFSGRQWPAIALAILALFVHPLMALPGVFLLLLLRLPIRFGLGFAAAALSAVLVFALVAARISVLSGIATVMDPSWLEVVRERSQFLFLKYWTAADWDIVARSFVCLALTALVIPDGRIRKLCFSAAIVGASGIAIAAIAGSIGPIAILLQGQAWRWMWVTTFSGVLLVVPTAVRAWRDDKCGPLCATLLILGWTFSVIDGLACVCGALCLWLLRPHISMLAAKYLKCAAGLLGLLVLFWMMANTLTFIHSPIAESGRESVVIARIREIFGLGISGMVFTWLSWHAIRRLRSAATIFSVSGCLLAAVAVVLPGSMVQLDTVGTSAEIKEFSDWRRVIPPTSTVLLVPTRKSASFMWFSLGRPSYLSVDQSSGVVFSRATSLEVRRRSEILLPFGDRPDWKLLTAILEQESERLSGASAKTATSAPRPLTASILVNVCEDPALNFVIANESVGWNPLRHLHPGRFKGWNLYDCNQVRSTLPGA